MRRAACAALLALAGCGERGTAIYLDIERGCVEAAELRVTVVPRPRGPARSATLPWAEAFRDGTATVLVLPPEGAEALDVVAEARDGGGLVVGQALRTVSIDRPGVSRAGLAFAGACGDGGGDLAPTIDLAGDAAPDLAAPDLAAPDLAAPDLATPDLAMRDLTAPDFAMRDLAAGPDLVVRDLAMPDLAIPPDLAAAPDMALPPLLAVGGTFPTGTGSFSIVSADFDADGKADVAVASYLSDSVHVLFGVGDGTFAPAVVLAVGQRPAGVAAGDFNGDGWPDVATANETNGTVSILLSRGDRTFLPAATAGAGASAFGIAVGDLDGDCRLDLVIGNNVNNGGTGTITVLWGDGLGGVSSALQFSSGARSLSVAVADLNGDRRLDIASANFDSGDTRVFYNAGGRTFGPGLTLIGGARPRAVHPVDLDGDRRLDLVVANNADATVSVFRNTGMAFAVGVKYPAGTGPHGLAARDLDGDGDADVVVVNATSQTVSLLLGDGKGVLTPHQTVPVGATPTSAAVADLDRDGQPDLAVADFDNGMGGPGDVKVLRNRTPPPQALAFAPAARTLAGSTWPNAIATADFNGDGRPDVVTSEPGPSQMGTTVGVFLGSGGALGAPTSRTAGSGPAGVVQADLNCDGWPDLATANQTGSSFSVLLNDRAGGFPAAAAVAAGASPIALQPGDFNRDGKPDLIVAHANGELRLYSNQGSGSFLQVLSIAMAASLTGGLAVADFNHDGRPDMAVSQFNGIVRLLLANGDNSFGMFSNLATDTSPRGLAVGYFDGDGHLDLAVAHTGNGVSNVRVFLGKGDGTFQPSQPPVPVGTAPFWLGAADLDRNGTTDLAVTHLSLGAPWVGILTGAGNGAFALRLQLPVDPAPRGIALADFDLDGRIDIAAPIYDNTMMNDNSSVGLLLNASR